MDVVATFCVTDSRLNTRRRGLQSRRVLVYARGISSVLRFSGQVSVAASIIGNTARRRFHLPRGSERRPRPQPAAVPLRLGGDYRAVRAKRYIHHAGAPPDDGGNAFLAA